MKCPNCQREIVDDASYCPYCGKKIELTCPSCHAPVSPHDKYCMNCGYPLHQEKDTHQENGYYQPINDIYEKKKTKIKWKPIIIGVIVLAILTGASVVYISQNSGLLRQSQTSQSNDKKKSTDTKPTISSTNNYVTYTGNMNLEGKVLLDGETIYMTNENGYLVSCDKSLSNTKVLLNEKVSYITPYNDYLYFADSQNYLCKISKKGGNKEVILKDAVYYVVIKNDNLYYQLDSDQEKLYVLNLKSDKTTKIGNSRTYNPNITDKYIYYTSTDGIYRMDLNGKNDTRLIEGKVYNLLYDDETLYYLQDNTLNIYHLNDKSSEQVESLMVGSFNKSGQKIYAYTTQGIVCYDLSSKKTKTLYAGNVASLQLVGDVVFVNTSDNNWVVVSQDGSQYDLFSQDSGEYV